MPSKKKKYNARFPAGRIKKIMQSDEEVGKVAQAVPIIISRTLELFVESMLKKTLRITNARNARTLSPSHLKQCIMSENRFDFLRELVKNVPDISVAEEMAGADETSSTTDEQNDNTYSNNNQQQQQTTTTTVAIPSTSTSTTFTLEMLKNGIRNADSETPSTSFSIASNSYELFNIDITNNSTMSWSDRYTGRSKQDQQQLTNPIIKPINPNYYTEISDNSPIQHPVRTQSQTSDFLKFGNVRSSAVKLNRLDSAPASMTYMQHNKNISENTTNSNEGVDDNNTDSVRKTRISQFLLAFGNTTITTSATTNTSSATTTTTPSSTTGQLTQKNNYPIPSLTPLIHLDNQKQLEESKLMKLNKSQPSTPNDSNITTITTTTTTTSTTNIQQSTIIKPPEVNVELCNTPLIKIDYSNLTLTDESPKTKTTSPSKSVTSFYNIDLTQTNPTFTSQNIYGSVSKSTTNLDLDEDYDNI